jgi:hypothetical protein
LKIFAASFKNSNISGVVCSLVFRSRPAWHIPRGLPCGKSGTLCLCSRDSHARFRASVRT